MAAKPRKTRAKQRAKSNGRGGARPGAGRPPLGRDTVTRSVQWDRALDDALRRYADKRELSIAATIRQAVESLVGRRACKD